MKAYRFFALLIALEVVIQAMAIAFAVFGESNYINNDGGRIDKAVVDNADVDLFTGVLGFIIHGINGTMVIPLLALIFLIVSLFAKVPGGARDAGVILVLVVLQIFLGTAGKDLPLLGPLHALNAFAILFMALGAAKRASESAAKGAPATG